MLPKVKRTTGEIGTYSERALQGFIAELVRAEMLAPSSNTRCMVIPYEVLDSHKANGRISCPEHRCSHFWSTTMGTWVPVRPDGAFDVDEARRNEIEGLPIAA